MKQNRKRITIAAFTIIEMVIVMLVLAAISIVLIPRVNTLADNAKITATETELKELQRAILGATEKGLLGYKDHMSSQGLPATLANLYTDPGTGFDQFTQIGWNGPYVDTRSNDGDATPDITQDAWGNNYVYTRTNATTGTIVSWGPDGLSGGGDDITLSLTDNR